MTQYLSTGIAALLSLSGIALLFAGTYLTGFGPTRLAAVAAGIVLFVVGALALRRQDSRLAERLRGLLERLFMLS